MWADNIIAGLASGRVRALINDRGEKVKEAGPSTPVEIMGFDEVPSAGDEIQAVGDDRLSRQVAEERKAKVKASREATMAKVSLENMFSNMESGKQTTLNLIIKADVQGSVEAVKQAMEKLSSDEVKVHVLHSAAGAITKDDVNLASASNAIIIGFNVRPDASAREAAEREKVDVRLYTVIYKAIEDMELAMKGLLAPEYREVLLGHAEVRNVFKITGAGVIAGCYLTDGKGAAQCAGSPAARQCCRVRGQAEQPEALQGRRQGNGGWLRVRHESGRAQRHQGRRCRRVLHHGGNPALRNS